MQPAANSNEKSEKENLDGWLAHRASAQDVQAFILDAGAGAYHIELSIDQSTWKRGFKIRQ